MGSGTTAMVARDLGRNYYGCELHESYGDLIQERVPVEEVLHNPLIDAFDNV